jgi:hypothetical protein
MRGLTIDPTDEDMALPSAGYHVVQRLGVAKSLLRTGFACPHTLSRPIDDVNRMVPSIPVVPASGPVRKLD